MTLIAPDTRTATAIRPADPAPPRGRLVSRPQAVVRQSPGVAHHRAAGRLSGLVGHGSRRPVGDLPDHPDAAADARLDRKSTRLNSSHLVISYAVFCLK